MIGFNHALAGIGIALSVRNPLLVAPIALISHFLLDIIPHFHHESFGNTLRRPYTRRFKQVLLFDTVVTIGITLLALYFFGGESTRTFVLALLIGIVIGTYSSIFNASQLLVSWELGDFRHLADRIRRRKPETAAAQPTR